MAKNIRFTISGVATDTQDMFHDGQLKCNYIYASSNGNDSFTGEDINYTVLTTTGRAAQPIILDYINDIDLQISPEWGVAAITGVSNYFSIYRREYEVYQRYSHSPTAFSSALEEKVYMGQWEPVVVRTTQAILRDFNVTSGRSYQYIMYPASTSIAESYANIVSVGQPGYDDFKTTGRPVRVNWNEWSLTELIPEANLVDAPIVRKTYRADINNIWLFKYSLETGAQTQNLNKSAIQTLGQFPKIGYGKNNYISGDVSCLLGSEIVPYCADNYLERMRKSIYAPLSSNEKAYMLEQWRKIAYSPNPKLLKDMKGQSWIVQIMNTSNTPRNFYRNQPDTISFSWQQIESTDNVIIIGAGEERPKPGQFDSVWVKKYND